LYEIPQKTGKEAQEGHEVRIERQVDRLRVLLVQRRDNLLYNNNWLQGREAKPEKAVSRESNGREKRCQDVAWDDETGTDLGCVITELRALDVVQCFGFHRRTDGQARTAVIPAAR
jgi:hypothetical protein